MDAGGFESNQNSNQKRKRTKSPQIELKSTKLQSDEKTYLSNSNEMAETYLHQLYKRRFQRQTNRSLMVLNSIISSSRRRW